MNINAKDWLCNDVDNSKKNNSLIVFFKKVVYSSRGHWNKIRSSQRYCLLRQIIFTATMIVLEDIFVTS